MSNARQLVITEDGLGIAALVASLAARGVNATVAAEVAPAQMAIFLGACVRPRRSMKAIAINREAFKVAKTVAARLSTEGGLFVTVQDTGRRLWSLVDACSSMARRCCSTGSNSSARVATRIDQA
ncbi:MAG: hypothetical protein U0165_05225 [Polyangiaceae bacterium]